MEGPWELELDFVGGIAEALRNARGLAGLFEFEEFEDYFEICPDMLRPFGWRRIQAFHAFRQSRIRLLAH